MADGSYDGVPPQIHTGQKGEMLRALTPIEALRRMEYTFAVDPNRFSFGNGMVPAGARQFQGACLLAWGAFYCKLADRQVYASVLIPEPWIAETYPQLSAMRHGLAAEVAIYDTLRRKNPYWTKHGHFAAAVIPWFIEQLAVINPALT